MFLVTLVVYLLKQHIIANCKRKLQSSPYTCSMLESVSTSHTHCNSHHSGCNETPSAPQQVRILFSFTFLQGFILNHLFAVLTTWPHLQQTAFQLFPWLPWWSILPQWQHQQGTFGHTLYIDKMMLKGQAVHQDKLNVTVGWWKKKQAGDLQPSV